MSLVPLLANSTQKTELVDAATSLNASVGLTGVAGEASSSAPNSRSFVPTADWCTSTARTLVRANSPEDGMEKGPRKAGFVTSSEAGVDEAIAPPGMFRRKISLPFK